MDTLALLCNLHADGPATLQRLRRSGCESLVSLRRLQPPTLAEWLGWSERTAERFLREAELLCERVEHEESGVHEEEEDLELGVISGAGLVVTEELDEVDDEFEDEEEEEEEEEEELDEVAALDEEDEYEELEEDEEDDDEYAYAEDEDEVETLEASLGTPDESDECEVEPAPSSARVEALLGTWAELDRLAPPGEPEAFTIPRPAAGPDRPLSAARLEGLDARILGRLAEEGVRTLRELREADALELSRAVRLGFTRVKRLQYLAGRALEREAAVVPQPAPRFEREPAGGTVPSRAAAFQAYTPPPSEPFEVPAPAGDSESVPEVPPARPGGQGTFETAGPFA